ncbi:hypothetical protein CPCC7001_309 [Cyanobium sp. PCC 7001]|nr:hypothetical protein CPCC7001_309 [Cyanobium sp. PCC 7001]
MPEERGLPLGLRILALVGALSFVMLGVNSLLPLLRWPLPPPAPPGPRHDTAAAALQAEPKPTTPTIQVPEWLAVIRENSPTPVTTRQR